MVTQYRLSIIVAVAICLAAWAAPAYVPPPVDAAPCGQIVGEPGEELDYCLWPGPAPLLVLLSALGNDAQSWSRGFVQALNGFAGVLVYDRRGYGDSATPPAAVTAETTAADLQALLRGVAIDTPVVLVGHGLGGLYAQYYARAYPSRVAAVVLIESASPLQSIDDPPLDAAAPESAGLGRAILDTRSLPAFPAIPLLVVSAERPPGGPDSWQAVQAQLAAQSPLGRQVLIGADASDLQDQPALLATQIRQFWRGLDVE